MSWDRQFDLYIDVDKQGLGSTPLLAISGDTVSDGTSPTFIQGDSFSLRLFFRTRSGSTVAAVVMPVDAVIVFAAKPLSALAISPVLFSATGFALEGSGDDACWVADLDLHTTNLSNAIGSEKQITVRCDIEIQNIDNTRRITFQFDAYIRRQAYAGEGSPTPAEPVYPAPGAIVVKHCGSVALTPAADSHAVTGLALGFSPAYVLISVRKPSSDGSNIFAVIRDDSISAAGFTVDFSAAIPAEGYKLDYLLIEVAS